jgi:hypothetical protein
MNLIKQHSKCRNVSLPPTGFTYKPPEGTYRVRDLNDRKGFYQRIGGFCLVLAMFIIAMKACATAGPEPTDAELRKYFLQKQQEFEGLAELIRSEPDNFGTRRELVSANIARLSSTKPDGIQTSISQPGDRTLSKWTAYKTLLEKTGVEEVNRLWEINTQSHQPEKYISFYLWSSYPRPKPALDEKGFIFTDHLPESFQIVGDTQQDRQPAKDVDHTRPMEKLVRVSKITDKWYIYFVRWGNIPPKPPRLK